MQSTTDTTAADRLLDTLVQCFSPEVASRVVNLRASSDLQDQIDQLAAKANEGELTEAERREYAGYVEAIDFIGLLQAKARSFIASSGNV